MKRFMEFAVKLYPAEWRKRYEAEFSALLEDMNPNWRTLLDAFGGAVAMQLRSLRFGTIVALMGLIGFLLALLPSYFLTDEYAATVILKIQPQPAGDRPVSRSVVSDQIQVLAQNAFSNRSLGELIQRFRLYPEKEGKVALEELVGELKESILIRPAGKDAVFVQFIYCDRFLSKRVAEELANNLVDLSKSSGGGGNAFDLGILNPVRTPQVPIAPSRLKISLCGLLAGAAIGGAIAFVRRPRLTPPQTLS